MEAIVILILILFSALFIVCVFFSDSLFNPYERVETKQILVKMYDDIKIIKLKLEVIESDVENLSLESEQINHVSEQTNYDLEPIRRKLNDLSKSVNHIGQHFAVIPVAEKVNE